jgi:hypothetical protein
VRAVPYQCRPAADIKARSGVLIAAAIVAAAAILLVPAVTRYEIIPHGEEVLRIDRVTGKVVMCAPGWKDYFLGYGCTVSADEILRRMEKSERERH